MVGGGVGVVDSVVDSAVVDSAVLVVDSRHAEFPAGHSHNMYRTGVAKWTPP